MSKGIIYVMTTVVPGLIKIGKTAADNFESRMYQLNRHGYCNVVGLEKEFAIEVEDYDEKEKLLNEIFSKSKVPNTELFALDSNLVVQLLSSFEGKQIYPEHKSKEKVFDDATEEREKQKDVDKIPNGRYYLSKTRKGFGKVEATMLVEDGLFTVLKNSICAPVSVNQLDNVPRARAEAIIENNRLLEDVVCTSPSIAGWVVLGISNNGWVTWKDKDGNTIDIFRSKNQRI